MKKIVWGFLLFLTASSVVNAQYQWSDPIPLTDSTSNNCNPYLLKTNFNGKEAVFFVWDKSEDTLSTEIWLDNILDKDPPQVILSDSGIHYSHPMIASSGYNSSYDIIFHILYQTDQNGNQDLYYVSFYNNDSLSEPQSLTTDPGDDVHLTVSREMFFDAATTELNLVAWINSGNLYSSTLLVDDSQYFSTPFLIDSAYCNSPSVSRSGGFFGNWQGGVIYEKADSAASYIYHSGYEGNGIWAPPETYYDSTPTRNPTGIAYYGQVCFSTYLDTSWRVVVDDNDLYVYDLSSPEPFDPAIMGFVIGVDRYFEAWVAITYPENGFNEIFLGDIYWPNGFINFSNSGTMNRDPGFFNGESYNGWCWFDYLVWESQRNGYWQIWAAKTIQCVGSLDEQENDTPFVSSHPNPFTHATTLKFTLESPADVIVEVYNNQGRKVDILAHQHFNQGKHQLRCNAGSLPSGIYIIKLSSGNNTYSTKVIKAE